MVARVASFEGINAQEAERTMDQAESIVRPMIEKLAGYQGHLELVSSNGKVLSITLFDSEENAQAAEPTFDEEMPRQLGDLFKGWQGRRLRRPLQGGRRVPQLATSAGAGPPRASLTSRRRIGSHRKSPVSEAFSLAGL